ncbi:AMP-binding protein [Streptomyces sp. AD2-2]|nr:AMP-binding protein [Streptomyces sp. AD2-2]
MRPRPSVRGGTRRTASRRPTPGPASAPRFGGSDRPSSAGTWSWGGVPCPRPRRGRRLPPRYPSTGPGGPVRRPLRVHRGAVHPCLRGSAHWPDVRGGATHAPPRRVPVGGERPDPDGWRRQQHAVLLRVHVTECTVTTSALDEGRLPDDTPEAPIGIPRADAGVGVCDSGRRPVPPGTAREIHIGGPSPASGLFGNPEGTARRFVTGPEPGGGRLCAVGDLGRILPDGNVELHGRGDDRAEIRGHRLEPAAAERLSAADSGVARAVVPPDARTRGTLPGRAAPAAPLDGVPPVTAGRCARPLAGIIAQLPGWAAPQRLSRTGALPENDHGRANRRALAGTLPTALTRTTAQGLSWTGALPENDHGRASRRALAGTLPTALTRATVQGTAPCEAVAASAPETRTASGTAERSEARAPGAGTGVPDGDAAARGSGWDAGAARRRAAALPGAAGRSRAGGRRRLPRRRLPADPCHAPGHAPDHRTPRRLPRDRRTAGHDRPRSSDTPPARPVALRGADPPPPDAGTVPTSLT